MPIGWIQVDPQADGEQSEPQVAVAADGRFVVVWTDKPSAATPENDSGPRLRLFGADGTALSGERTLDQAIIGRQDHVRVAFLGDGSYVAAWESPGASGDGTDVIVRRFAQNGTALSNETIVNAYRSGEQVLPAIAASGNRFAVAWNGPTGGGTDGVAMRIYTVSTPGVQVTPQMGGDSGTTLAEAGGTLTFDVVLTAAPASA